MDYTCKKDYLYFSIVIVLFLAAHLIVWLIDEIAIKSTEEDKPPASVAERLPLQIDPTVFYGETPNAALLPPAVDDADLIAEELTQEDPYDETIPLDWELQAVLREACEEHGVAVAPPIDCAPLVEAAEKAREDAETKHDNDTMFALARTVWGEARGCNATEQAAVVWCILNRVDSPDFPGDPMEVIQQPNQFSGYDEDNPVLPEILVVVEDVLARWEMEKTFGGDVGRVLPKEYVFFEGDGKHNHFRTEYKGGTIWDWRLDASEKWGNG